MLGAFVQDCLEPLLFCITRSNATVEISRTLFIKCSTDPDQWPKGFKEGHAKRQGQGARNFSRQKDLRRADPICYPPDLLSFGAYILFQPFIKQIKG